MPKELMLFVKNMVFLDGAVATLAPDLDIIGEIGNVSMHFATVHGERLAGELGLDPSAGYELDLSGVKAKSEEHTSELQSLMRISYAVFCLKKKTKKT